MSTKLAQDAKIETILQEISHPHFGTAPNGGLSFWASRSHLLPSKAKKFLRGVYPTKLDNVAIEFNEVAPTHITAIT